MFNLNEGQKDLESSGMLIFDKCFNKVDRSVIQLGILIAIVIATDHADKLVMLQGKGAYIKK